MKTIRLIAWNTIQSLNAKKVPYVLPFLILIVAADQWQNAYNIFYVYSDLSLFIEQVWFISLTFGRWYFLTVISAIIFASGVLPNEQQNKTIVGVMAKPIARWKFILGKWCGLQLFFGSIFSIGIVVVLLVMWYWNIPVETFFYFGVVNYILLLMVFSTLSFVLSIFMPRVVAGGIAFGLFYFDSNWASSTGYSNSVVQVLESIFYYTKPADMPYYIFYHENYSKLNKSTV